MISRRGLITGGLSSAAAFALQARRPIFVYVGSYSSPQGPEGSHGYGKGIYLFHMDPETGALSQREVVPNNANPSWLAIDSTRTHLYSANETADGSVSAYSVDHASDHASDRSSGHLTLLNTVSSQGAGPAHLSVHPSGKHVLVANYAGGTVAVLPILAHGELGQATDVKHDQGPLGPAHAASAPPGSFAISGHDSVHAHMIQADPSGRFVLSADLALDRILVWKFDAERGTLSANDPPWAALPPGDGPRHFVFHPNGRWLYSLQEEGSTLVTFDYDAARGVLTPRQTVSRLPKGFAGTNFTSEVRVSPDARFVYAANRFHDSIAWFSIDREGNLSFAGEEWTRGDYPRSFTIDPTGSFLYTCNQHSDVIACFRVSRKTGALTFTGQYTAVGTPAIVVF